MKQVWTEAELSEHWTLHDEDYTLLKGKTGQGRLALAVLLRHYQLYARFPKRIDEIASVVLEYVGFQVEASTNDLNDYACKSRTGRQHRCEILSHLGIRPFDKQAANCFRAWLIDTVFPEVPGPSYLDELITEWLLHNHFERPGGYRLERMINSAERTFDRRLFQRIHGRLNKDICLRLDGILSEKDGVSEFSRICADLGPVSLDSVLRAVDRLETLRGLELPADILQDINPKLIERYRQRARTENAWELRRHPAKIRHPLLVFYCASREGEITDRLVDLLIQVIHKISVRAERKIVAELVGSVLKVQSKTTLLYRIAEAVLEKPDGAVRDVVFPVVNEQMIEQLVKEYRSSGPAYVNKIHEKVRASYAQHYRRMLPRILEALEFRCNNAAWRPILDAIDVIKAHQDRRDRYFAVDDIPVEGVVRQKWRDIVIEKSPGGTQRANRINYEICVLQELREKLRCKEVWVVGARHFCNPDDDLPTDFDSNRQSYYEALNLPLDAESFIADMKGKMAESLSHLNKNLPRNGEVAIKRKRNKPSISVTPLKALPDPPNLDALKRELNQRWPATSLLDVLKETDFRVGFTKAFATAASREVTRPDEVLRRLLLALYGLGTNAGLKCLAGGPNAVSYKELLHTRRRYIHKDSLRNAIRQVVNATLQARLPHIWGEGTTACASDSTQFSAWDQNLMTEWHVRYGGRGVMIYWHVDINAVCIYSQLKRCSSSEVASMIEGVLHHCTEMEIERQYVDSHGQSVVAFAFCHLLGFTLMPRFKGIDKLKLAQPDTRAKERYPNLEPIFTSQAINWDLIAQQYDELVKFSTALRTRTAEADAILRRFTRSNVQHPTYAALIELGRVVKTIFLCNYLGSEELRREVNTGLNVVERWNGVNSFIYFGKSGEIATNNLEDQEVSVLALHLLQVSLVYINTLMIQQVLREPGWQVRMTERDMRALSPLPHSHINPYGVFDLDMEHRIPLDTMPLAA
ncbi:MAG: Tn3 family transposase [Gammaproteobacteria bacterium]|nr:Tn3 family transposase [Gammaproteobacteria bacterium]